MSKQAFNDLCKTIQEHIKISKKYTLTDEELNLFKKYCDTLTDTQIQSYLSFMSSTDLYHFFESSAILKLPDKQLADYINFINAKQPLKALASSIYIGHLPKTAEALTLKSELVVQELATNPYIKPFKALIKEFANSDDLGIRTQIAANPIIRHYPDLIHRLRNDRHAAVRSAIRNNYAIMHMIKTGQLK